MSFYIAKNETLRNALIAVSYKTKLDTILPIPITFSNTQSKLFSHTKADAVDIKSNNLNLFFSFFFFVFFFLFFYSWNVYQQSKCAIGAFLNKKSNLITAPSLTSLN